ncbi:Xin actin-binding repeat-containing protein 1 [Bienertia sinuspersici]
MVLFEDHFLTILILQEDRTGQLCDAATATVLQPMRLVVAASAWLLLLCEVGTAAAKSSYCFWWLPQAVFAGAAGFYGQWTRWLLLAVTMSTLQPDLGL